MPAVAEADGTFDAVVVGAGTAGAGAAYQLAARGLSVALIDRRPAELAGAHWHNGVLDWQFERAGLEPPVAPERVSDKGTMRMIGPDGSRGPVVSPLPTVTANMARLGQRLRDLAVDQGVTIIDRVEHLSVERTGDRIVAVDVQVADDGQRPGRRRLVAPLFVDASGRAGVLRKQSSVLARWCPPVRGDELCSAGDHHFDIADRDGALGYLDSYGARPGETITEVGIAGGFSTRAITVHEDVKTVGVLIGCLANGRYGTAPRHFDELRATRRWIGEPHAGGFGVIPLRRPYARFTAPGLALVGDAACQVLPAHGSGIGIGLIAGRLLAEAVADAADPGDEATVWRYQAAFQREFGGEMVAFDVFRRMTTALGSEGVGRLVETGLMTEEMAYAGLDQRWAGPRPSKLPAMAAKLPGALGLVRRMAPWLARSQPALRVGRSYPQTVDENALTRWDTRVERLLGPLPS